MTEERAKLLICTVGGSPEPIVVSLGQWRPQEVRFVHTPQTKDEVENEILPMARDQGVDLDLGRYELFQLTDGENLESCLDRLRDLTGDVTTWAERGGEVVVDFTGGTKCMSVAIALQASRWPCVFSYVGGKERTRDGVGVVVKGAERIVSKTNPWEALGYRHVEEFIVLFDKRAFRAAADLAKNAKERVTDDKRKREFAALEKIARAFDFWDRFKHKDAKTEFTGISRFANDLRAVLDDSKSNEVLGAVEEIISYLNEFEESSSPGSHQVLDILANAKRRKDEGRVDDAVGRVYRAIEVIAQVALKAHGFESTEKIPLDRVPESLQAEWKPSASDGYVSVSLQRAYQLLESKKDPLAETFRSLGLKGKTSPLAARNNSILAHGFTPVPDAEFDKLWEAALSLANVDESSLPSFLTLGNGEQQNHGSERT